MAVEQISSPRFVCMSDPAGEYGELLLPRLWFESDWADILGGFVKAFWVVSIWNQCNTWDLKVIIINFMSLYNTFWVLSLSSFLRMPLPPLFMPPTSHAPLQATLSLSCLCVLFCHPLNVTRATHITPAFELSIGVCSGHLWGCTWRQSLTPPRIQ